MRWSKLGIVRVRSAKCLVAAVVVLSSIGSAYGQTPGAEEVLSAAIAFHDPERVWATGAFRLQFEESRPDGSVRKTAVVIDNAAGRFEIDTERQSRSVRGELGPGTCRWLLDGSVGFSGQEQDELRLTCERLEWIRDYYVYLWGLPMKLRDPGTLIDPGVKETTFEGREALEVRVTYEAEVGSDSWYFYFDPADRALIGYRFYHDEATNDGEYIVLEGLGEGVGLRLPRRRTWYTHQERKLLGTDTLVSIARPDR